MIAFHQKVQGGHIKAKAGHEILDEYNCPSLEEYTIFISQAPLPSTALHKCMHYYYNIHPVMHIYCNAWSTQFSSELLPILECTYTNFSGSHNSRKVGVYILGIQLIVH